MKQREVVDEDNTRWTCVQAYSGVDGDVSEKIEEKSATDDGLFPVVCTPSGGAQSVRVNLPKDWEDMSDEDLVRRIQQATPAAS
jgi:Na+-translocating ferredoxin:NAD+ oxidoreductase RnfC subunit